MLFIYLEHNERLRLKKLQLWFSGPPYWLPILSGLSFRSRCFGQLSSFYLKEICVSFVSEQGRPSHRAYCRFPPLFPQNI